VQRANLYSHNLVAVLGHLARATPKDASIHRDSIDPIQALAPLSEGNHARKIRKINRPDLDGRLVNLGKTREYLKPSDVALLGGAYGKDDQGGSFAS
jgi:hypothetical protein